MTPPTLLVLAAGMGSRYGGLKQMDEVGPGGETILDYSVYDALRAGFAKAVFVLRRELERPFRERVAARFSGLIAVECVFQDLDALPRGFSVPAGRTKPWGTAQAVLMAAEAIREPFAVVNADDFYGAESFRILAAQLRSESGNYALVAYRLLNTLSEFGPVARGVCQVSEDGYLESVVEWTGIEAAGAGVVGRPAAGAAIPLIQEARLTGDERVSMNMWGFDPRVFAQLQGAFVQFLRDRGTDERAECYLPNAVQSLLEQGAARVQVSNTPEAWFGVTYRQDRERVIQSIGRLVQAGVYPARLWP